MELLIIIVNDNKSRKKVKSYLKDIGLGDFIVIQSVGCTAIHQYYTDYKPAFESAYQGINGTAAQSKTIFALIKDVQKTEGVLDHIATLFQQNTKNSNTGIAFTIPFDNLFS